VSLRWRLVIAFAALAAVVTATVGIVVYEVSARDHAHRARAAAIAQVTSDARYAELNTQIPAPDVGPEDPAVPATLATAVAHGAVATYIDTARSRVWAGSPSTTFGAIFYPGTLAADETALADLARTLAIVGTATTVAGALLGLVLATRLSRRLRLAATTAGRVAAGDLDARIGEDGRDEVAALGRAVDEMAASLQGRIEHERRFVADVAHDLRTPLTGLVTAAELLPTDQVGTAIRGRVRHLRDLVEDLLEIARLDAGVATPDLRRLDLATFVPAIADRYEDVRVTIGPAATLAIVDPRRLERIVENLLQNARRHGRPPVEVTIDGTTLLVRDHGDGFPAELIARAADRFRTGDPSRKGGVGLGLAIAVAQTRVLGGVLDLANHHEGGALVTVTLPGAGG
jgi:signal transduction histidine kinase